MDFLTFLKDYYYLIALVLALVVLVLQLIITLKKQKDPSILSFIDKLLPQLIIDAEDKYGIGHGDDKLMYVFRNVASSLATVFNINDASKYEKYISTQVEKILETPQKKEGHENE